MLPIYECYCHIVLFISVEIAVPAALTYQLNYSCRCRKVPSLQWSYTENSLQAKVAAKVAFYLCLWPVVVTPASRQEKPAKLSVLANS